MIVEFLCIFIYKFVLNDCLMNKIYYSIVFFDKFVLGEKCVFSNYFWLVYIGIYFVYMFSNHLIKFVDLLLVTHLTRINLLIIYIEAIPKSNFA